jgi:hypothetical protein
VVGGCGWDSSGSEQRQVAGCYVSFSKITMLYAVSYLRVKQK